MTNIEQIQIQYVAQEDRLLMRIATGDGKEFRFWLTRRFVKLAWPALNKSLARRPRIAAHSSPETREELLNFEREAAVARADFASPYRAEPKALPLGEQPALLTRMQITGVGDDHCSLAFTATTGATAALNLNAALLHSLINLIANGVRIAEWDLDADAVQAAPTPPENVTLN